MTGWVIAWVVTGWVVLLPVLVMNRRRAESGSAKAQEIVKLWKCHPLRSTLIWLVLWPISLSVALIVLPARVATRDKK